MCIMERKRYKSLYLAALKRIDALEQEIAELRKPERKKMKTTNHDPNAEMKKFFKEISKTKCPGLSYDPPNKRIRYCFRRTGESGMLGRINYVLQFDYDVGRDSEELATKIVEDIKGGPIYENNFTLYVQREPNGELRIYYKLKD